MRLLATLVALALAWRSHAVAQPAGTKLAAVAPPAGNDARRAVLIGARGEVYEPDGKGAWIRKQRFATADAIAAAGRAGGAVVAFGEGVIYKLAPNGWSALRLAQKGKAVMATGRHAVGAVGRQLYALDRTAGGEPAKLVVAANEVTALGAGKTIVVQTTRGLFRFANKKLTPVRKAPRDLMRLVGDRWALVPRGVTELETGKLTPWPAGFTILAATLGPDERTFVGVGSTQRGLELVTIVAGKLARSPLDNMPAGKPVGVVVDRSDRAIVAFADGRIAVRERGAWTLASVSEALPGPRPGPAPATSP